MLTVFFGLFGIILFLFCLFFLSSLNTFEFFLLTGASVDGVPITLDLINAFISVSSVVVLKFNMSVFCCRSACILVNVFTKRLFYEIFNGNRSEPLIAATSFLMFFSDNWSSLDDNGTDFEVSEKTLNWDRKFLTNSAR